MVVKIIPSPWKRIRKWSETAQPVSHMAMLLSTADNFIHITLICVFHFKSKGTLHTPVLVIEALY